MRAVTVKFQRHAEEVVLPDYAPSGAAGMDIAAAVEAPVTLAPCARAAIPTGFCLAIPRGYEIQVRPRSGLAIKHGVTVANAPGTIDSDYRGEVKVLLINLGQETFTINRGDRIAQMVVAAVTTASLTPVDQLDTTERGGGGFGSTGGIS